MSGVIAPELDAPMLHALVEGKGVGREGQREGSGHGVEGEGGRSQPRGRNQHACVCMVQRHGRERKKRTLDEGRAEEAREGGRREAGRCAASATPGPGGGLRAFKVFLNAADSQLFIVGNPYRRAPMILRSPPS